MDFTIIDCKVVIRDESIIFVAPNRVGIDERKELLWKGYSVIRKSKFSKS